MSGKPDSNAYATTYSLKILADDGHTDVNDYELNSTLDVLTNQPPTIQLMDNVTLTAPDGNTWSYGATLTEDPESLNYTTSLLFDGSSTAPAWFKVDISTYKFLLSSSSNSMVGSYNITLIAQDDFNTAVQESFFLNIIENTAPQLVKFISNFVVSSEVSFIHQFDSIDELFSDLENRPMAGNVLKSNGDPLPPFLSYNQTDNTLNGSPSSTHVRKWNLMYVATDDYNHTSSTAFILTIKTCFIS